MDTWEDRVSESAAMAEAKALLEKVREVLPTSSDHATYLRRVERVVELVEWTLTNVDHRLVPEPTLTELGQRLGNTSSELSTWEAAEGDEQLATNAMSEIDHVLIALGSIPIAESIDEARTEVNSLRGYIGDSQAQVDAAIADVQDRFDAITQSTKTKVDELATAVGATQDRLPGLQEKLDGLETAIGEQRSQTSQLTSDFQAQFSQSQESRLTSFDELLESQRTASQKLLEEFREESSKEQVEFRERATTTIEDLEDLKARAAELVGVVANTGTAGGYKIVATEQRRQANWMRLLTIVFGLAAVGISISFFWTDPHDKEWIQLFARLAVATALGGLATYTARQSADHRERELVAKKIQLELASLDPFLVNLPQERQENIKADIALRLYAQPAARRDPRRRDDDSIGAGRLLDVLQGLAKKIPDAD